jgi:anti-sigma B factor antagonist
MLESAAARSVSHVTLVTSREGETTTIRCAGKLVAGSTGTLQTGVRDVIPGSQRIVLDLQDLAYMDSSGLGSIIGLYASVKSAGGRLELINMSPRVRELFKITNVLSLFEGSREPNVRVS